MLLNWNEAKEFCAARGAQLAQPDSQAKNENIKANLPSNDPTQTWFGARIVNNQWQYTDGSTLLFTNWNPGRGISFKKKSTIAGTGMEKL